MAHVDYGDGTALDTPLPTPTGWTTIGDVGVGDRLIGSDGLPTTVVNVTGIFGDRLCYRVTFTDESSIVASAGHQWLTKISSVSESLQSPRVRTTEEIATLSDRRPYMGRSDSERGSRGYQVLRQRPLKLPGSQLPIDPYVLGLWLGDGSSWESIIATGAIDVDGITQEIQRRGFTVKRYKPTRTSSGIRLYVSLPGSKRGSHSGHVGEKNGRAYLTAEQVREIRAIPKKTRYGAKALAANFGVSLSAIQHVRAGHTWNGEMNKMPVSGLRVRLREQGLMGNKHIPSLYLRAGLEQREELLRGLMDSDGHANADGFCTFVQTSEVLVADIVELLRSLGQTPRVTWRADSRSRAGGLFKVTFTPRWGLVPFSLRRKAERVGRRSQKYRCKDWVTITSIEATPTVPVRCVAVDAPDHLFVACEGWHLTHDSRLSKSREARGGTYEGTARTG